MCIFAQVVTPCRRTDKANVLCVTPETVATEVVEIPPVIHL